ncbi:extracellular solute-binding protein [Muricomes sp. OA1]|jgi:raffinose/stachyose/melibiose transport system substrate-binding protein|uniref:Extracellular solute-binding protein n=1 Tax=Hungatella hathewayi TaxID=154046 RepID=A0A3E2WJP1_9FIRM|nr:MULTISPECIES: extracellular solute-binding protein [Clostridia]MCH1972053.1 extracellular solute-binding protein [Muricomes sp. OA1]MRM88139.1 extracellular solute-binding protein [Faecalicatena contorta]RGC27254.1 extracellular solute-binding protein [Hungatella hathewayi]GKH30856.1 sugar ABC transporter substrate-binding protein [Faecalicatena contorta]
MRKKKLLSLGIALVMIAGLAAGGCSQKGSGSTSDSSGAKEQESSEPVELEFLFGDPNRTEIFSRIVEDFNNSQDGVHVTFNATGTNHLEELMTRLAADDAPDLTSQLQGFELASYVDAGYIKDIKNEPFMKYIRDTELDTVTIEDGVYGIPMDTQAWGVFYNKELFEKAGISDVPVTVSELKDCVEKLKASGITPFAAGYATEWTIGQFLGYGASSILTPAAVELGDDYKKGNWTFDQPGIDQAFDVLDLVADNTQDRPFDTDVSGQYAAFAKGDAAMMLQGNWSILQIRELNPDIKMGMFPLPISEDKEALLFPKQYGFVINVLAASEEDPAKAEAINQFMEYFLNPENGGGYYYDEIGVPTANAVAEPELDEASEILQTYLQDEKTVFTYYAYEPAGFDAESWKVTVQYLNSGTKDHKKLIEDFDNAFNKYADALE